MIYGYARVSTEDQNLAQQIHALELAGCQKIFSEKISTRKEKRPQLEALLSIVQEGDSIYIVRLDRLARSTLELIHLAEDFRKKGIGLKSLTQEWLDTTSGNPMNKLIFTMFAGFAQFERDLIQERIKEGLAEAKRKGRISGRKPFNPEVQLLIAKLWDGGKGETLSSISRNLHIGIKAVRKYAKTTPIAKEQAS